MYVNCATEGERFNKFLLIITDKGPLNYYVIKEVGGWGQKWQFLLIYSIIYADASGRVGLKKAKNMLT